MEEIEKEIDLLIFKKYEEFVKTGNEEKAIEALFRKLRWSEPELAIYIKKKMKQFADTMATRVSESP